MMPQEVEPIQKILFGSPGTGKSYQIREIAEKDLGISYDEDTRILSNTVKTVFHPEYTYADFMGKLLPLTQGNSIIYKFYPGHFLQVLGKAYKSLLENTNENFLLVIDELNRGNAAAIFGNVFQLLDRESDGWSSYETNISEMELFGLLTSMDLMPIIRDGVIEVPYQHGRLAFKKFCEHKEKELKKYPSTDFDCIEPNEQGARVVSLLKQHLINIPPNLSIIATINTSDESIYYLDSAFKRRWDWEYVDVPSLGFKEFDIPKELKETSLFSNNTEKGEWYFYIVGINELIKSNYQTIRRIEDKQIGWWFIKPQNNKVELQQVKNKLMFYLWDSVFARDKKPLEQFLSTKKNSVRLTTYSDFLKFTEEFMEKIYKFGSQDYIPF